MLHPVPHRPFAALARLLSPCRALAIGEAPHALRALPLVAGLLVPAPAPGLTWIQTVQDSPDGLGGARGIAVRSDPTGRVQWHAYIAATDENALSLFRTEPSGSGWRYAGKHVDGVDGVDGLAGAVDVAVSPDGARVYVAGADDDAIAIFERSPTSGLLHHLGAVRDGDPGFESLDRPVALSIVPSGPDAGRVFVVSSGDHALVAFDAVAAPELVQPVGTWRSGIDGVEGLGHPSDVIALAGNHGADVYVVALDESSLAAFTTDASLQFAQRAVLRDGVGGVDWLAGPRAIAAAPEGTHLFVAAAGDQAVSTFIRATDTGLPIFYTHVQDDLNGVSGLGAVLGIEAEGSDVFATGSSSFLFNVVPTIVQFHRPYLASYLLYQDTVDLPSYGYLSFFHPPRIGLAFPGGSVLATHPVASTLSRFSPDSGGALSLQETIEDGEGVIGIRGASDVVATPDGANVYVIGREQGLVTELARDPLTGRLSMAGAQRTFDGELTVHPSRNATLGPGGQQLYVFDMPAPRITVFRRDVTPGRLSLSQALVYPSAELPVSNVQTGVVSPEGTRMYTISWDNQAFGVFVRDPATGSLTYLATDYAPLYHGRPKTIAASPDGRVYTGGHLNTERPMQFDFDPSGTIVGGYRTVPTMPDEPDCNGMYALAFDPSFRFLVTGQSGNHLCTLERDPADGALHYVGSVSVPGLQGPVSSLLVSPDGRRVLATFSEIPVTASTLAVFALDPATGALELLETISDATPGVDDTHWLSSVALAPGGRHIYAAAFESDAVVALVPEPGAIVGGLAALLGLGALRGCART